MEVNLLSISYLFFRLAPFIIVCFFVLNSVFNQDLRGLIYLCGLMILIACVILAKPAGILILNLLFLMRYFSIKNSFNIFWPVEYLFNNFSSILTSLLTKSLSIVILIMLSFSLFFHTLELSKIEKLQGTGIKPGASPDQVKPPNFSSGSAFSKIMMEFWSGESSKDPGDMNGYCMEMTFNGTRIIKPIGASVYGFTYAYLLYFIEKYDLVSTNLPVIIFFPMVAIGDFAFQNYHKCKPSVSINIMVFIMSALWGLNWGDIVNSMKNPSLQYFVGGNQPVCSIPNNQNFVCNVYKNGQLIGTQTS